jgi:hypothetical protein
VLPTLLKQTVGLFAINSLPTKPAHIAATLETRIRYDYRFLGVYLMYEIGTKDLEECAVSVFSILL